MVRSDRGLVALVIRLVVVALEAAFRELAGRKGFDLPVEHLRERVREAVVAEANNDVEE